MGLFRRRRKRRIQDGLRDDKTFKLYKAACLLLAERDDEQIPVAYFAQQAGMSVGAFYERFSSKDTFLGAMIAIRFGNLRRRMVEQLDRTRWQDHSAARVSQAIIDEMMRNLHGYGAGVVRTALKRGYRDRTKLAPLLGYRTALADQAVALLAERVDLKKPEHAVRAAVQMAEATALDALLHERGPLRQGSRRMAATLSAMMLRVLELNDDSVAETRDENDDTPDAADDEADRILDMPIEEVVVIPVPDSPPTRRRSRPREQTERIPIVRPTSAQSPPAEEKTEPSSRKRRHRPTF